MYGLQVMDNTQSITDDSRLGEITKIQTKEFDLDQYRFISRKVKGYIVHENARHLTLLKLKNIDGKSTTTYTETFLKQDIVPYDLDVKTIKLESLEKEGKWGYNETLAKAN